MSSLVAINYESRGTAEEVLNTLAQLQKEHSIALEDAVIVTRSDDGKVKLHQSKNLASTGAAGGALWGGLIGLIFFVPLFGMALGAAAGAASGKLSDTGIDDQFMKDLGEQLQPGKATLILLVRASTPDKVLPAVAQYGGEVLHTSLDDEREQHLRRILESRDAAVV
jgi:uncharacterized membrane protein